MNNENQLDPQPGDILYFESSYHGFGKVTVERLTNTQIVIAGYANTKLKRPFRDGSKEIGASGYGSSYYYRETEELKAKYEKQELVKFITSFVNKGSLKDISIEQLTTIKNLLK